MVTRDLSAFVGLVHISGIMRDVGHVIDAIGGGDNRFFYLLLHLRVIAFSALKMARQLIMSHHTVIPQFLVKYKLKI